MAAGCGAAEGKPVERQFFGINAQYVQQLSLRGDSAATSRHLASIESLGVAFVRANVDWMSLQPDAATTDFATHDRWVAALAERGLRWQVTAVGIATPPWARDPSANQACAEASPPTPGAFARLTEALAERYGSRGAFWTERPDLRRLPVTEIELWNEPNFSPFWCPVPNPEQYAAVAAASAQAVHRADPATRVALGGLAGFAESNSSTSLSVAEFAARAVAAQPRLSDLVEVVAVHPYARDPFALIDAITQFRADLDSAGLTQPITVNEIGWPTSGQGGIAPVPEATRAAFLQALPALVAASGCEVSSLALHTWATPERFPADPEDWFGVADPASGAPYPVASAYGEAIAELREEGLTEDDRQGGC